MLKKSLITAIAVLAPLAMTAMADWDPTTPYTKWVQMPDLSPTGLDVNDTQIWLDPPTGLSLADDWLCEKTGPVTDFHIWGSWLFDKVGVIEQFRLAIYADIPDPDGTGPEYSMPGTCRWNKTFQPGEWVDRIDAEDIQEGWYDPVEGEYIPSLPPDGPADTVCWQHNFLVDEADAFVQQEGTIYWFEVQVWVKREDLGQPFWGWKTSLDHWNDDAVWMDPAFQWNELRYPLGHPLETQSIDLAFALTTIPEPATMGLLMLGSLGLAALKRRRRTWVMKHAYLGRSYAEEDVEQAAREGMEYGACAYLAKPCNLEELINTIKKAIEV